MRGAMEEDYWRFYFWSIPAVVFCLDRSKLAVLFKIEGKKKAALAAFEIRDLTGKHSPPKHMTQQHDLLLFKVLE